MQIGNSQITAEEKKYRRMLGRKKVLLRFLLVLTFLFMLTVTARIFLNEEENILRPQIQRAEIQIAKMLPQMKKNEETMRGIHNRINESLETLATAESIEAPQDYDTDEAALEEILAGTLSWMEGVTKLRIGEEGYAIVISQEDGKILAHPNPKYIGSEISVDGIKWAGQQLKTEDVSGSSKTDADAIPILYIMPRKIIGADINQVLGVMMVGSTFEYQDTYIVCGVPFSEIVSYVAVQTLFCALIYLVLGWLLVKYISMIISEHKEQPRPFRRKLLSFVAIAAGFFFVVIWYTQIVATMTSELNSMRDHAETAAETVNDYGNQRSKIDAWLDQEYLKQCRMAADIVSSEGRQNLTAEDMQRYADILGVEAVYAFDRSGKVAVTNAPYDHFRLSSDPKAQSYAFRPLLQGEDHVIQEPREDDLGHFRQYIGVSTRDKENRSDGFVQIAIDPSERELIQSPLSVETILSNTIVGMPEEAFTVDSESKQVTGTTGLVQKGLPISDAGITENVLTDDYNGLLNIYGKTYYAGAAEASGTWFVSLMTKKSAGTAFLIACVTTVCVLACFFLIAFCALAGYRKKILEGAEVLPKEEPSSEEDVSQEEENEAAADYGLFSEVSKFIKNAKGRKMASRWGYDSTPKEEQTPEMRIQRIIYWLLLFFCIFVLVPQVYVGVTGGTAENRLTGIAYVISGRWEKGVNIFALTSCIFLLCGMYVFVVLINRMLYFIARFFSMRVETICLLIRNSMKYICAIIFIYYGLSEFGVQTQTLLASAGILGLMISMGARELVSDIVAGIFLIFEGTLQVGDFISVGSWNGTVEEIGLRTTKVTFFGDSKVFNNSSLKDFINSNGDVHRILMSVPIGYEESVERVEAILEKELPPLKDVIPGLVSEPKYLGVDQLDESSVNLAIQVLVTKAERFNAKREMNRWIKLIFDQNNITIPYSQVVVHNMIETGSTDPT